MRAPNASIVSSIARRDFLVLRSYRAALGIQILYGFLHLGVYYFISQTFASTSTASLQGAPSYFAYAAVGLVVAVVLESTSVAIALRLREEQLTGTLEALVAAPVTSVELCVGTAGFPFAFAALRAGLYLAVAAPWMDIDVGAASWLGVAVMLLCTGFALAPIGILGAALVLVVKRAVLLASTAVYAMGMLGGAVFPIEVLPDWLEWLGRLMPVRFAFDGVRAALFTGGGWEDDALILIAFGVVLGPLALVSFAAALRRTKAAGTLSEY